MPFKFLRYITRIIFYTIFAKIFRAYYFKSGIIGRTISLK